MRHITQQSKRVIVRKGYSEQDVWRGALGDHEPLLSFVTYGPLDAPGMMPVGGCLVRYAVLSFNV